MSSYWQVHPYTIIGFLLFSLLIALGNVLFLRRLRATHSLLAQPPFVSILVPARNEALNIERCVRSLLAQSYPSFEVLVLDDHSTDETPAILAEIQNANPQLKILRGEPLPAGWLGKHWACHQLARAAQGELFLFTDADTWHEANALRDSIAALTQERVDLLTLFPHEAVVTWGEKLTVPVLGFAPFSFIPVFLTRWFGVPRFSITIGQFMLFRQSVYEAIGGYEAVRSHPLDDVKFGRRVLSHGFKWLLADGTHHVHCRMYRDFRSSAAGLTRSLFAFFTNNVLLYVFAWTWIGIVFLEPILILILHGLGFQSPFFPAALAWVAVLEAALLFLLIYLRFRFPVYLAFFYPLSVVILVWLAFRSLVSTLRGKAGWKDRSLPTLRS
ncbi:MAG TPA: glycosyltransferase family 2 protein [Anaerolineales bacterium]|jgi:chlorobactene glucosyltransferase|nr:glycosyltransferase family 2 protein [Anaerolineales bacterium]